MGSGTLACVWFFSGICGVVGRATACVCGDAGSIPTCGALVVWPWTLGSKTAWLVNKSAGRPPFWFFSKLLLRFSREAKGFNWLWNLPTKVILICFASGFMARAFAWASVWSQWSCWVWRCVMTRTQIQPQAERMALTNNRAAPARAA